MATTQPKAFLAKIAEWKSEGETEISINFEEKMEMETRW